MTKPIMKTTLALLLLACSAFCGTDTEFKFLPVDELPAIETLPNPFVFNDGSPVKTVEDWEKRREEIKAMVLYYEYGHMPPAPGNVKAVIESEKEIFDGKGKEQQIVLTMGPNQSLSMHILMNIPTGSGPFPVIIKNANSNGYIPIVEEMMKRGYISVEYGRTELDPDETDIIGPAQAAYPDYDWATLAVWAWGGSRVIDYLYTLDFVDKQHLATTGHSRGGKTALLLGAMDERIALTNPNGSGCGGAGSFRILGERSETLEIITKNLLYWFHPRLRTFAEKVDHLPFDQHSMKALVAPRALVCTEASGDLWGNPYGSQQTHIAAKKVYEFLGAGDKIGIHFREGQHDQLAEDWLALLDYADLQFFGKKPEREFYKLPFPVDERIGEWAVPKQ